MRAKGSRVDTMCIERADGGGGGQLIDHNLTQCYKRPPKVLMSSHCAISYYKGHWTVPVDI